MISMNLSNKRLGGFTLYPKGFSLRLKSGFTLIELLVVVAIIGVLATVVLASLGSARDRAKDAKIKATLSSLRSQAEIEYLNAGDYSTVCNPDSDAGKLFRSVFDLSPAEAGKYNVCTDLDTVHAGASGNLTTTTNTNITSNNGPNANGWAANIYLNSGNYFCVDSEGTAKEQTGRLPITGSNPRKTC